MVLRMRKSVVVVGLTFHSLLALAVESGGQDDTAAMKTQMQTKAVELNKPVAQSYSSSKAVTESVVAPINGAGQLSTFDGKKKFDGKLACKGSAEYAKFIVKPESNGDLTLLNIFQDTNMDGAIDNASSLNWRMTAICSNGFMQCTDPDNAASCTSYKWTGSPISRQQVSITDLGGCYCINNKCGSHLVWSNLPQVISDVGTGIAGALAAANPWYTLSEVRVDGVQGSLVGGESNSCSVTNTSGVVSNSNIKTLSSYINNPTAMTSTAEGQTTINQGYLALKNGATNTGNNFTTRNCEIRRNVAIDEPNINEIIAFDGGEGSVTQCGPDCIQLVMGRIGNNYWGGYCEYYEVASKFFVKKPDRIKSATLVDVQYDDWMQMWVKDQVVWNGPHGNWTDSGPVPGSCQQGRSWHENPNLDFTQYLNKEGPAVFKLRVEVYDGGEGYALLNVKVDLSCKAGIETISDGCKAYADDDSCKLEEETVDGVKTFTSGIKTGLAPLEQTINVKGNFCSVPVTKPWFYKKRTYRCSNQGSDDLSLIQKRSAYIKDNVTASTYKDIQYNKDGKEKYSSGVLNFNGIPTTKSCTLACKTRSKKEDPGMAVTGSVSKNQNIDTYNFYYHECSNDNVCPAAPGETIIKQCQCLDEFADAAAVMQILRQAGQDMICSSGTEKKPNGEAK